MTARLPVEQVGPDLHRHVARVIGACFGVHPDDSLDRWCDVTMSDPARTTYAAFDGWTIVAVSSLVVGPGTAELSGAATLPGWRGRGIYTDMVGRRLEDAARLGIRTVHARLGTDPGDCDGAATGARVLRRLGFREAASPPGGDEGPEGGRRWLSRIEA